MAKTKQYLEEIQLLQRDYRNALQEAQAHRNDDLSYEGLQRRRAQLAEQASKTFSAKLEQLKSSMDAESGQLKSRAGKAIPKAEGSTRDSWERVKMLLDAGQTLHQVIGKADPSQLQAIQEWAPTWLDATTKGTMTDFAPFQRSVDQRWAQVAPDPEPITEYLGAAGDIAKFEYIANSLGDRFEGRAPAFGSLADAFGAEYAAQTARTDLSAHSEGGES